MGLLYVLLCLWCSVVIDVVLLVLLMMLAYVLLVVLLLAVVLHDVGLLSVVMLAKVLLDMMLLDVMLLILVLLVAVLLATVLLVLLLLLLLFSCKDIKLYIKCKIVKCPTPIQTPIPRCTDVTAVLLRLLDKITQQNSLVFFTQVLSLKIYKVGVGTMGRWEAVRKIALF